MRGRWGRKDPPAGKSPCPLGGCSGCGNRCKSQCAVWRHTDGHTHAGSDTLMCPVTEPGEASAVRGDSCPFHTSLFQGRLSLQPLKPPWVNALAKGSQLLRPPAKGKGFPGAVGFGAWRLPPTSPSATTHSTYHCEVCNRRHVPSTSDFSTLLPCQKCPPWGPPPPHSYTPTLINIPPHRHTRSHACTFTHQDACIHTDARTQPGKSQPSP